MRAKSCNLCLTPPRTTATIATCVLFSDERKFSQGRDFRVMDCALLTTCSNSMLTAALGIE